MPVSPNAWQELAFELGSAFLRDLGNRASSSSTSEASGQPCERIPRESSARQSERHMHATQARTALRGIVKGLRTTFTIKADEFRLECAHEANIVARAHKSLEKRLDSLLDRDDWNRDQVLEISAVTFLLAVGMGKDKTA